MDNDPDISSIVHKNQRTLDALVRQLRQSSVIPYVGAGLSIPFGFDGWTDFLISASPLELRAEIDSCISMQNFEEAAERLRDHLGHQTFQDLLAEKFGPDKLDGKFDKLAEAGLDAAVPAVLYVPALTNGPVATTNLDRVLEYTYDFQSARLDAIVWGARSSYFKTAILEGRPVLLKVHGDVFDKDDRVLTKSEYDDHYRVKARGARAGLTLPGLLEYLINNKSLLFLGCSLTGDRLMQFLKKGTVDPQIHYAIVRRPPGESFAARSRFLGDHCIRPVWYDSHEQIAPLLDYLIKESSGDGPLGKLQQAERDNDWRGAIRLALTIQRRGIAYPPQRNAYLSRLHYLYAKSLAEAGDLTGAVSQLRQACITTPADLNIRTRFIEILISSGRVDEAEIELEEFERLGAEPTEVYRLKAILLLARGPGGDLATHSRTLAELTEASLDTRLKQVLPVVTALLTHQFGDLRDAVRALAEVEPDDPVLAVLEQLLNTTGKKSKKAAEVLLWVTWEASSLISELKDDPLYTVNDPVKFGQWAIKKWLLREDPNSTVIQGTVVDVKAVLPPGEAPGPET